jgi:hypothetical protein
MIKVMMARSTVTVFRRIYTPLEEISSGNHFCGREYLSNKPENGVSEERMRGSFGAMGHSEAVGVSRCRSTVGVHSASI